MAPRGMQTTDTSEAEKRHAKLEERVLMGRDGKHMENAFIVNKRCSIQNNVPKSALTSSRN